MSAGGAAAGGPPERQQLAARARARLGNALDDLVGERLRLTEKRPRDGAGWVDVSGHDLSQPCPARWSVPVDDFVATTRTVAGAVARLALRERRDGESPTAAVERVLADVVEIDPDAFFIDWYLGLDRAAQGAVRAAATTWAVGALRAVGGRPLVWVSRRQPADVEGRTVRLKGTWDASDRRARPDVLVVMTGRSLDDEAVAQLAGFNALVDGLLRREVVARVRVGSAATSATVAVPVTADLLDATVDRVVELVGHRVEPDSAPAVPGRWCRHCPQLEVCPEGTAHLSGAITDPGPVPAAEFTAADVVELVDLLEGGGVEVWVDGGWGVDALVGRRTRPHGDLDVVVRVEHVERLWEVLGRGGFVHTPADDDRPWNFVVTDGRGRRVDVHAVTFTADGDARYGPPGTDRVGWPAGTLDGVGVIGGRPVRCTVASQQVASRTGYELRPSDHHDLDVLRSLGG